MMYYVIRTTLKLWKLLISNMHLSILSQRMSNLGWQVMALTLIELWALNIICGLSYWFHIICLYGCLRHKLTLWCLYASPIPLSHGNDIHVYLRPLIEELKELWIDELDTFDHSRKATFRMRATLSVWSKKEFMPVHLAIKIHVLLELNFAGNNAIWAIEDFDHLIINFDVIKGFLLVENGGLFINFLQDLKCSWCWRAVISR